MLVLEAKVKEAYRGAYEPGAMMDQTADRFTLLFGSKDFLPRRIVSHGKDGEVLTLHFDKFALGAEVADEKFVYTPPPRPVP